METALLREGSVSTSEQLSLLDTAESGTVIQAVLERLVARALAKICCWTWAEIELELA